MYSFSLPETVRCCLAGRRPLAGFVGRRGPVAASLSFYARDPTATTANAVGTAQIDKTGFQLAIRRWGLQNGRIERGGGYFKLACISWCLSKLTRRTRSVPTENLCERVRLVVERIASLYTYSQLVLTEVICTFSKTGFPPQKFQVFLRSVRECW
jgi:hypothetical protein